MEYFGLVPRQSDPAPELRTAYRGEQPRVVVPVTGETDLRQTRAAGVSFLDRSGLGWVVPHLS